MGVAPSVVAHPFDGDGAGDPKEGGHVAQAYLYLEPGTVRVECLLWLPSALERFKVGPVGQMVLPPEAGQQVVQSAKAEAPGWCRLWVDGAEVRGGLVSATVLKGMPGRSEVPAGVEPLAVIDGMVGLIWQFETSPRLEKIEMTWSGLDAVVSKVPVTVFYGSQAEAGIELTKETPGLSWESNGRLPEPPALAAVPAPPPARTARVPGAALGWVLLGGGMVVVAARKRAFHRVRNVLAGLAIVGVGAWVLWPVGNFVVAVPGARPPQVTTDEARAAVGSLVENVYRAFDQNSESAIYDVLERSVEGPLLQTLYLQTIQALTLEGQDGTRVKVNDLYVHVDSAVPLADGEAGFVAECQWTARGTVGHWGHLHQRLNRYTARVTVEDVKGAWKMTGLEVMEERRL